jgi:hypothetical protein
MKRTPKNASGKWLSMSDEEAAAEWAREVARVERRERQKSIENSRLIIRYAKDPAQRSAARARLKELLSK